MGTDAPPVQRAPAARAPLRSVAVPHEHGGWGLTLEPVLLGLLVVPSVAGAALGAAALLAFLVRTPLKVVGVDAWRHRSLPRTRLAAEVAAAELLLAAGLVALAAAEAGHAWWLPLLAAAPLIVVEAAFDVRSRGRRLAPELCGAVGIASVATAIARAGGSGWAVAIGLWLVLAGRAAGAVPFVRAQVRRARGRGVSLRAVDLAQVAGIGVVAAGWAAGAPPAAAVIAVAAVLAAQAVWATLRPPPVAVVGVTQLLAGLLIVVATACSVR